jgi:hypothetical protein
MREFYPTPKSLAIKSFMLFKSHDFKRILEPSAGRGDLLCRMIGPEYRQISNIDCIEIDLNNQAILRDKGLNVVDSDFMTFSGASMYSHIIMNPPFSNGVDHCLKAWDLLYNGELVCILNAETIKNPHTSKRKLLVDLIKQHGSVEFIDQAFTDPDTLRKTNVEIALIHMEKKGDIKHDYFENLNIDSGKKLDYQEKNELALKGSSITNAVTVFNAAVRFAKKACIAQEEANYYARLMDSKNDITPEPGSLIESFNIRYAKLRENAWQNILNSTDFSKHLSEKAYNKLMSDFEQVSKLSFTEQNIRSFLIGLIQSKPDMNMQMLLDCFDEITKYHYGNRAYYRGWKSNDRHKDQAYRVQMTRFILPVRGYNYRTFDWEMRRKIADFDKVFYMLDGKQINTDPESPDITLEFLFTKCFDQLRAGQRLSSDYFDVRYYAGARTIHFFPTNKTVVDRLNRLVGKERQWIPQDEKQAGKEFWKQYDKAEKITNEMDLKKYDAWEIRNEKINLPELHLKACDKLGIDTRTLLTESA